MSDIRNEKNKLRNEYILIRNKINNKNEKSKEIFNSIINTELFKEAKTIALYKSINSEVDTKELIKYSIDNGKIVVLPKVEDANLKFYKINSIDEKLFKSKFGIKEPKGEIEKFIDNRIIDLVIVPGICFDCRKNRLGFGKGYYDSFLKERDFKTIGICFDEQIVEKVPIDNNDMQLKEIITDKRHIL